MSALATLFSRYGSLRFLTLAMFGIAVSACGPDPVTGRAELFDRESAALTVDTVLALKGTYGSTCTARSGAWAIALNGYHFIAGETQLSVVAADVGCVLSVTEIKAGSESSAQSFKPATPFALTAAYASQGVALMLNGTGAVQFYANLRLQPDPPGHFS